MRWFLLLACHCGVPRKGWRTVTLPDDLRDLPVIQDPDDSRVKGIVANVVIGQRIIGISKEGDFITISLENGNDLLVDFETGEFAVGVRRTN